MLGVWSWLIINLDVGFHQVRAGKGAIQESLVHRCDSNFSYWQLWSPTRTLCLHRFGCDSLSPVAAMQTLYVQSVLALQPTSHHYWYRLGLGSSRVDYQHLLQQSAVSLEVGTCCKWHIVDLQSTKKISHNPSTLIWDPFLTCCTDPSGHYSILISSGGAWRWKYICPSQSSATLPVLLDRSATNRV